MAGSMEAPPPHSELIPFFAHRIPHRGLRHPLIKGSFEETYYRYLRHSLSEQPNAIDIGWVVRRGQTVEYLHRLQNIFIQPNATGYTTCHDGLEPHSRQ